MVSQVFSQKKTPTKSGWAGGERCVCGAIIQKDILLLFGWPKKVEIAFIYKGIYQ